MSIVLSALNDTKLSEMIISGKIGILPTDTIYGLVASAKSPEAASRILLLKGRDKKPGTMIAGSVEQLVGLGIKKRYLKAVENYWPAPVSIVLPIPDDLDYLHAGRKSLPVRVTDKPGLYELLLKTGPLITTSANMPDEKPAENLGEAREYFGDKLDFYVDVGHIDHGPPSTIIQIIDDAIEVLRQGSVKIDESGRIIK